MPLSGSDRQCDGRLRYPIGKWLLEQQKLSEAEEYANIWAAYPRAPARALLWAASHQATRGKFAEANDTLEGARNRLADGAPVLPQMITCARADERG
jgi:hypothetical protein